MENPATTGDPNEPANQGAAASASAKPKWFSPATMAVLLLLGGGLCAVAYYLPEIWGEKPVETAPFRTGGTSAALFVVDQWSGAYKQQNKLDVRFSYESTGTTEGINMMTDRKISIGFAHDEMSPEQLKKASEKGGAVVQVPIVLCGVVPVYNIKNLTGESEQPKNEEIEKVAKEISGKDGPERKAAVEKLENWLCDARIRDVVVPELTRIKGAIADAQAKRNLDAAVAAFETSQAKPLNFTADLLAKIFLGEIKEWDHAEIKDLNKGHRFPKKAKLTSVHRRDSSGTTHIFTDYLQAASKVWQEKIGKAASKINWPAGEGMDRNNGVATYVDDHDGAIGYVDLLFAKSRSLDYGSVLNKDGVFIHAEPKNLTAATQELIANIPDNLSFKLTNKSGSESYPITGVIWAACYQSQPAAIHKTLTDFLQYITHEGQELADKKKFARLPPEIIDRVDQKIKTIKVQ